MPEVESGREWERYQDPRYESVHFETWRAAGMVVILPRTLAEAIRRSPDLRLEE
jgi:hypothetical protein